MSLPRISKRYASALSKVSNSDEILKALHDISELFEVPKFKKLLLSPVVPIGLKFDVVKSVCRHIEDKALGLLIKEVVEGGRTAIFPHLYLDYKAIMDRKNNLVTATLFTANEVGEEVVAAVSKLLQSKLGKEIRMNVQVDEELLGGFVVRVGNSKLDLSLRSRVEKLVSNALN